MSRLILKDTGPQLDNISNCEEQPYGGESLNCSALKLARVEDFTMEQRAEDSWSTLQGEVKMRTL